MLLLLLLLVARKVDNALAFLQTSGLDNFQQQQKFIRDLALKVRLNVTNTLLENECYIISIINVAPKDYSEQE